MQEKYQYAQSYPGMTADEGWHEQLQQKVVPVGERVLAFFGFGTSIFGAIRSDHGYILVDTGDRPELARQALNRIREYAPGKLQAILLTHSHADHRTAGFVFLEDAEGDVPVYGHWDFNAEQKVVEGLDQELRRRTSMQFGMGIPDNLYTPNAMIPRFVPDRMGPLLHPNTVVPEGGMKLEIDGVSIECLTLATETPDHVQYWLPELGVLFCGDSAYGSFPNLYPLRGGVYRDVQRWGSNVRKLAELGASGLVCGHYLVVTGQAEVAAFLDDYARAVEYTYAETIKGIDSGIPIDELAATMLLPEDLRNKPYLAELYGNVSWAVREIYAAKVGWFDGNPANIVMLTNREEAKRMAGLAGGTDALLHKAIEAFDEGDDRWAARLANCVLALEKGGEADVQTALHARTLLADVYERMSARVLPITAKNYLLSAALNLRKE